MPTSYTVFKEEIKDYFLKNVPNSKRILDVGPGEGTYSTLLNNMGYQIDAIEIWRPYIEKYSLREKYDNVYLGDILEFNVENYDFIILGDVLEHIPVKLAQELINKFQRKGIEYMVAVPYMMEQGEWGGNIHETHYQPDLTPENMLERYPSLELLYSNEWYGYYISKNIKVEKAYVLYANAAYFKTVQGCVASIKAVSDLPIFVYLMNFNAKIEGAKTVYWNCDIKENIQSDYIDRSDPNIYNILIQRPEIVKHCLLNYADTVAYIDSDSVATHNVDKIFSLAPKQAVHPYFVEGMYDWLQYNGKGGVEDETEYHKSLEYPACELFNVNQFVRKKYRQTGYFVASKWNIKFLNEWIWMCNHPEVKQNPQLYAPYNEETLLNVLLWKHNIQVGLPYLYVNGNLETIKNINNNESIEEKDWFRLVKKEDILFFHGEKSYSKMIEMTEEIGKHETKLTILFLAPHLSTGGMPAFLLERIKGLLNLGHEIFVIEYQNYSMDFVVQRNAIIELIGKSSFYTLSENKKELLNIINDINPDIVHIDEMSERLDNSVIKELYDSNRSYRIIETCHDISFNPETKHFTPDAYAFCTPYHLDTFKDNQGEKSVIEFPINPTVFFQAGAQAVLGMDPKKKHIVNIGLWTSGKNQKEMLLVAKNMPEHEFHFVGNQAGNFESYWKPLMETLPPNVTVWGERSDAHTFMEAADIFMFNSTWECNPLVLREAIGYGKSIIARNLPQYKNMFISYIEDLSDVHLKEQVKYLIKNPARYWVPTNNTSIHFAENHVNLYKKIMKQKPQQQINTSYQIHQHFVGQPFIEITGDSKSLFTVEFWDKEELIHAAKITVNSWVKVNREYYTDWITRIYKDDVLVYDKPLDYTGKRVYISFDSSSLGDTIAWFPYVEEFRKKHNCTVIVSTYKNFLFKESYPELEFVEPGTVVNNIFGMYKLGWFYDDNKEPVLPNTIPLQQTATNILGLEYTEIRPKISFKKTISGPQSYVAIATNSTAGCKFWTKENWQAVINYLVNCGYNVINTSLEDNSFTNCATLTDKSIEGTMSCISNSEFFIGLSSGLSWLAWTLNKEVIMISNFTEENHEFKCHRPIVKSVCHGCWNNKNFKFDKGDWNWCPINKGTDKQFECQSSITPQMIIEIIDSL